LLSALRSLSDAKREYDKYAEAIRELDANGYGIVMPDVDSLKLEEPEIVKQAGGYGVRLRASAPSVHMIRASIETEINPIVGTEQQSEELVRNLLREFEEDPKQIWESNLFGRSLYELINDGLHAKLAHMPDDARQKLGETLSRVINEGSGGLICIIL
jgi:stage IV sporulation protein A